MNKKTEINWIETKSFGLTSSMKDRIEELCRTALKAAQFAYPSEITLTFTDDNNIQSLNKTHRGKDKPTNVLSFPAYDPGEPHPPGEPVHLGDIVLAHETCTREAEEQEKSFEHHVMHLTLHGLLHLIGHDHEEEDEADEMEALEIAILDQFGIKNPYET